jgi:ferredoxin-NADP reductase
MSAPWQGGNLRVMILLQALGVLAAAAAAFQICLVVISASKRAARENEQRHLALALLQERVLAARKVRQIEGARQTLSWSGHRKFVVARKVFERGADGAPAAAASSAVTPWKPDAPIFSAPIDLDASAIFDGLYRGRRDIVLDPHDLEAWTQTFARDFSGQTPVLGPESSPKLIRQDPHVVYPIQEGEVTLGRAKDSSILIDNTMVSRHHAKIFRKGPDWFIQDLGSHHGTQVNREAVDGVPVLLHPNDHIRLANVNFSIEFPGRESAIPTAEVCSFYLVPHDGKPLPPFLPGQYLTFQLRIPGIDKPTIRCYSLSDCAHPDYYRVTIKRTPPPKDRPDLPSGVASTFFHDQVREGEILDVQAPRGGFSLDLSKENPVVLIGGGIGLTPVLSMLNAVVASGSRRETWFFYGVRNRVEHVMKEHLERVARENPNVHIHVCYSAPIANDLEGRDYHHRGHVSVDLMKKLLPSNNYEFYTCGPPAMMNQMTKDLLAWGVPEGHVHYEAFGPATVKKVARAAAEQTAATATPLKVTFSRSGKECTWDSASASLLEFAEAQGVRIDSGCRAGNCGTCITAVRSGQFCYTIEPGAAAGPGTCLTCVSVPKGDLVLDA